MKIREHHQRAIERLRVEYENDPRFLALIIGGSVAKGCAREDSDVDFMIVATAEAYQDCKAKEDLFINRTDLCDYPSGFVDGKIINLDYLEAVALKGNEPSRAAFDGAFLAFSHRDDLDQLMQKIRSYPEIGLQERMRAFYAMAFIQNWLMGEANRHDNRYTKTRAANQLALFAGRLILAHNKVLYPYHKWFLHYLEKCPNKPEGFLTQMDTLLQTPNAENANTFFQNLRNYHDWGVTDHQAYMWFMEKVEWSWMDGTTPLEDV
ncbi:nucleotidyltransferase domain-containing protein [Muricauda sp. 2012CJ35-5]|uniref:Nucleotidyltransferase domain-containing protein n=1 Tax=Flagellimonas spongiicola TaxID=2942208 RepID=A0ABT0PPJ1_9FLAO|nr:nucleotidyltransferase domain-containing protein [Allomuricauda spongiicola]MCL6273304.1 nucleotidyltransferase domain-containing protein [Allomuricauda spongiicola]